MANLDDYYQVLGVSRTASDSEIKQAYRREALRWHPDKNPKDQETAEHMFKAVAEAYDVLSNPEKRSLYDRFGMGWKSAAGTAGGGDAGRREFGGFQDGDLDPFFIFQQFFRNSNPFFDLVLGQMQQRPGHKISGKRSNSVFDDVFFGRGGNSVMSTSTTRIVNGRQVTITERTVTKPDGSFETTRSERIDDPQDFRLQPQQQQEHQHSRLLLRRLRSML
eukprot:TRINITY_DN1006_c4_g1_i1.p1 TRINITY_DN1006_c4_g1~~TRINITY_DN1006_c4_g1_i1.p1  ORF type:complete len:220 (+),score=45.55 TRINITY_DN1006_c4_g1_i1:50-709(+)